MSKNFMDKVWLVVVKQSRRMSDVLSGRPNLEGKLVEELFKGQKPANWA